MRIIAGKFRGKQLNSPKGEDIRPTSDRVRESLFNILASRFGTSFEGLRVLDLFAGTGALGIEALSRGAAFAVFVDSGVEARGIIREHIEMFGLGGQSKLLRRDATALGPVEKFKPFDLVFVDPPYGEHLGEQALVSASANGWFSSGATVVLEERKGVEVELPESFVVEDRRDYADTSIWILSYQNI